MSKKDLVESLEFFRAERPDEWIMDDFISQAKEKNKSIYELEAKLKEAEKAIITAIDDHIDGLREDEFDPEAILVDLKTILK